MNKLEIFLSMGKLRRNVCLMDFGHKASTDRYSRKQTTHWHYQMQRSVQKVGCPRRGGTCSGGFRLGQEGAQAPEMLPSPQFWIGSIVIGLAVVASRMMRGRPAPSKYFSQNRHWVSVKF